MLESEQNAISAQERCLMEDKLQTTKAGKAGATPHINYPGNMNALDSKTHNEVIERTNNGHLF